MGSERCKFKIIPTSTPLLNYDRFVLTSTQDIKDRQTKNAGDVDKELDNLNKKLHYLETTYNNAQQHLDQIFKGSGS